MNSFSIDYGKIYAKVNGSPDFDWYWKKKKKKLYLPFFLPLFFHKLYICIEEEDGSGWKLTKKYESTVYLDIIYPRITDLL